MTPCSFLLIALVSITWNYCAAFVCHTCQYSENVPLIGYECVTSPGSYSLGPATGVCSTPCHTLRQISISTGSVYYMWRGCQHDNSQADGCVSKVHFEECRASCSTDLCNGADMSVTRQSAAARNNTTELTGPSRCYSCVYSHIPGVDDSCVTDVTRLPTTNHLLCPLPKVCSTFRQWDKGNRVVRSFSRGCEEQLGRVAGCVQDAYFVTCTTYCTGQYCNDGDGILAAKATRNVYRP